MKKLLLLVLIGSCTAKGPNYTPDQEAILKYVQHNEPDSTRYVALRFSKPSPYTVSDSISFEVNRRAPQLERFQNNSNEFRAAYFKALESGMKGPDLAFIKKSYDESVALVENSVEQNSQAVKKMSDKIIGQQMRHDWRVGERADSAHFVVFGSGTVREIK